MYLEYADQNGHEYVVEYDLRPENTTKLDWAETQGLLNIGGHNNAFVSTPENNEYITVTRISNNKKVSCGFG
jgi:hypothetical protein